MDQASGPHAGAAGPATTSTYRGFRLTPNAASLSAFARRFRRWGCAALFLGALLGIAVVAYQVYYFFHVVMPDAYGQWVLADVVIQYMEWHDGAWPRDWNDLQEPFEEHRGFGYCSLEELRDRLDIDFTANPKELARAEPEEDESPFCVIWLRNGKHHHWQRAEPNRLVWEYLQERGRRPPTYRSPKPPDPHERPARMALLATGAGWKLDADGRVTQVSLGPIVCPSGADLGALRLLTEVRGLNLGYSAITDVDLQNFADMVHVQWIYLYGTNVTDAGLAHLSKMSELETLVLAHRTFTDSAFDHIVQHPRLKLLNLNGTRVTNAGLERLHGMTSLREVMVADTLVTEAGVQRLRESLKGCKVYFSASKEDVASRR
jgi:hypothetical protein